MNAEKMLLDDAIKTAILQDKKLKLYKKLIKVLLALNIALISLCIVFVL